jgi:hypothetical protein
VKTRFKRFAAGAAISGLVALSFVSVVVLLEFRRARDHSHESAVQTLCALLTQYQSNYGRCPESLATLSPTVPDSGPYGDLGQFEYTQDGTSCSITWTTPDGEQFSCGDR